QGEDRRPLYIECAAAAITFQPDKKQLTSSDRADLRREIETRLAEQKQLAGAKSYQLYLLLLVRPDGIERDYQAQSVLRDLKVDFGYEFIDADWVLAFPAAPPPPVQLAKPKTRPARTPATRVSASPPSGGSQPSAKPAATGVRLSSPVPLGGSGDGG